MLPRRQMVRKAGLVKRAMLSFVLVCWVGFDFGSDWVVVEEGLGFGGVMTRAVRVVAVRIVRAWRMFGSGSSGRVGILGG